MAGLAGLAALDSLNPATLVAVTLILLGSRSRPVADTLGFVAGAFLTVFVVGARLPRRRCRGGVVTGSCGCVWRRFGLAAAVVLLSAVRALRPGGRRELVLPTWFTPATAAGLGVLMTGADLPNAFPYFIAIERLVTADVGPPPRSPFWPRTPSSTACRSFVLLAIGLRGGRITRHLRRLHDQFGTEADIPASTLRAAALTVLAAGLATIAVSAQAP